MASLWQQMIIFIVLEPPGIALYGWGRIKQSTIIINYAAVLCFFTCCYYWEEILKWTLVKGNFLVVYAQSLSSQTNWGFMRCSNEISANSSFSYICSLCKLPNFSVLFFENSLDSLCSSNSFDPLNGSDTKVSPPQPNCKQSLTKASCH